MKTKKDLFSKLLIEKSKKGREDGAYSRLFGNNELGALISRIHATSISAGTFLEHYIACFAPLLDEEKIPQIFNNTLEKSVFLITKKSIKNKITPFLQLDKAVEPDFIIIDSLRHKCLVIELKDGDNFDTKKSSGEVKNLKYYQNAISQKLPYPWIAEIKICMFNQNEKSKIVNGFRNTISEAEAMSGDEFCKILGISKDTIIQARTEAHNPNLDFVLRELLRITICSEKIKAILKDR
ncbi:hypothetical protein OQH61_05270 [Helicobacter sp. MIT 21-1697]|uniref:hypothetical protein n=1 Tax=Helicobacter sp. MIT 21-1697 TaxID=2993733 RepID=UPI00224AEA02|nr:hypothetical protein [Helicobacter sp. MIT 21-1697]MCX2717143.1 hypothetical protein [Helicobacter sp. MIT 21-1697]